MELEPPVPNGTGIGTGLNLDTGAIRSSCWESASELKTGISIISIRCAPNLPKSRITPEATSTERFELELRP